jgi:hypothetical protein
LRRVRRVIQTLCRFAKRFFKKNQTCLFNSQLIPISRPETEALRKGPDG